MEKIDQLTAKAVKQLQPSKKLLPKLRSNRNNELLKKYPSGKDFLVEFNFDFCVCRYENFKTVETALKSKMLKLNEISATYNKEIPVLMLKVWLVALSMFMDFEISPQQAKLTSKYIMEEVGFLNLAEITLLFKRIQKGKYGTFYGKFNGQLIVQACIEYRQERGKILSKMSTKELQALGYELPYKTSLQS